MFQSLARAAQPFVGAAFQVNPKNRGFVDQALLAHEGIDSGDVHRSVFVVHRLRFGEQRVVPP